MNDATQHADHGHDHADGPGHFTRRGYLIGFLLSVVLTAVPFWLVMTGALQDAQTTAIVIIAFAVVQILVHTVCFLHVNTRGEGGWTLMAYAFTAVIVLIVIAGSLWIMYHLNSNMMPMPSAEMSAQP
ncbi:cytochrome o ubiquinol oxidase subunit IV [Sphingomonas psychrotolerans]|uniref:Cytochrome bo(3) ubiquinol oxidase subunit 4 n=1 Tax=Sphingomonas psychrotolerans TaxID=1327635 RepID=A0A2K8MLB5_9SPHN|nr:cytochrome o ubiquinol oxidase subunit IV [Sphingomonas psychrotolerans]ATY33366.1 cytochrome o ubiquinol oxidase subunit IV [Sphingomonas psychrotolerans]